ncbi:MAG: hypothetical protein A2086_12085 [Spirochaetes bacterium GWD1_27_9]|nr:MAG: hypothetical protein A2Z98_03035 [Spirochaetes bacterium GWB1_27_13]OHD22928.1 MAG: hypothetical protein A2Y34_09145 [Spirochaetes bacterium GWC1_27_15]OHD28970.1 MAG: hypothetical protein A2086_12085 [Spirochaetes bacterium GWD1_27_9]
MDCNKFNKKCVDFCDNRKKVVTEAEGKKFVIINNSCKKFCKLVVDGCIFDNNEKKCDYLVLNCDDNIGYLVELKGRHLLEAIEQINISFDKLKNNFDKSDKINAVVIVSKAKTPDLNSTKEILLKKKLKEFNGKFYKKEKELTINEE